MRNPNKRRVITRCSFLKKTNESIEKNDCFSCSKDFPQLVALGVVIFFQNVGIINMTRPIVGRKVFKKPDG